MKEVEQQEMVALMMLTREGSGGLLQNAQYERSLGAVLEGSG